jgi:hypothetical protein
MTWLTEVARGARVLLLEIPKLNIEDIWKALYDSLGPLKGQLVKCPARHSGGPVFSLEEGHLCAV